ncbi:P-loop containing nucleoside triphosphate hydrolase protein [Gonapodya prolifera JEL478]|uniref:Guanine nucleotide-binding protein-like 1 n=1 Tax=Gonapodya prolifera (strain JEL478) TaxID=1344416 RepID=A0A139A756_GONPJ|nr:P-loop containing nucleoside triphosphate hydrolase protein [Gonapodya prolifera JEL478]|eukprot:KXS12652.1 P-loop containing nucleoside triphosphate hydrolase protein [Gonapodya prolifera JEL478]
MDFYYRAVPFSHAKKKAQLKERNSRKRLERDAALQDDEENPHDTDVDFMNLPLHQPLPRPIPPNALEIDNELLRGFIDMPKRPPWKFDEPTEELDERERRYFEEWVAKIDSEHGDKVGYFERDLETWRQLWRVLEMSNIVLLVVDIRNPVFHFPPSLYHHVMEDLEKPLILVLNKIDLVTPETLAAWVDYFRTTYPALVISTFSSDPPMKGAKGRKNARPPDIRGLVEALKTVHASTGRGDTSVWEEYVRLLTEHTTDTARSDRNGGRTLGRFEGLEEAVGMVRRKHHKKIRREEEDDDVLSEDSVEKDGQVAPDTENTRETVHQSDDDSHGVNTEASEEEVAASDYPAHPANDLSDPNPAILTIGLVGHPNVGKSSLINAILGTSRVSVSRTPGRTKHFQTLHLSPTLRSVVLCDSPGLVFPSFAPRELQVLMGIYKVAQVAEPWNVVGYLGRLVEVERLLGLREEILFEKDDCVPLDFKWTASEVCEAFAIQRGYFTARTGYPDIYRSANLILRMVTEGTIVVSFKPPGFYTDSQRNQSQRKH